MFIVCVNVAELHIQTAGQLAKQYPKAKNWAHQEGCVFFLLLQAGRDRQGWPYRECSDIHICLALKLLTCAVLWDLWMWAVLITYRF